MPNASPSASTTTLKEKVKDSSTALTPRQDIRHEIEALQGEFGKALKARVTPERFVRVILTQFSTNPKLFECTRESILGACFTAAQMGLEFGPLGHAYLVPYRRYTKLTRQHVSVCQLIIGYRGYLDLARRSGEIKDILATEVYEKDQFDYWRDENGDHLLHRQKFGPDRGAIVLYYAHVVYTNGGNHVRVMTPEEIETRRNRSASGDNDSSPWKSDYLAMARKSCIRAIVPYLPLTVEVSQQIVADEAVANFRDADHHVELSYIEPGPTQVLEGGADKDKPCCDKHAAMGENDGSPCAWDAAQEEPVPITGEAAIQAELPPEKLEAVIARVRAMNLKQVDFFLSEYELDKEGNPDTRRKRLAEYLAQKEAENLGAEES